MSAIRELTAHTTVKPVNKTAPSATESIDNSPDGETVGEFVPGYDAAGWYGVGAPKSTPADIVDKLNREVNAGLADTKLKARLAVGPNAARGQGYATVKTKGDNPQEMLSKYVFIWEKVDGKWKLDSDIWNLNK